MQQEWLLSWIFESCSKEMAQSGSRDGLLGEIINDCFTEPSLFSRGCLGHESASMGLAVRDSCLDSLN